MAKKQKSSQEKNSWVIIFAVCFIVATVLYVLNVTQKNLEVKNQLTGRENELLELKSRGINTDPVNIRKLMVNHQFATQQLSYNVKNAYLASDIADFGDQREEYQIGTKNKFLIAEVDVEYAKEAGQKLNIDVNKYVTLREGSKVYKPVSLDALKVGPLDMVTAFVTFVVPMESTRFSLLTGPAGKSKLTTLNFVGVDVEAMEGVFLLNNGFASVYPTY